MLLLYYFSPIWQTSSWKSLLKGEHSRTIKLSINMKKFEIILNPAYPMKNEMRNVRNKSPH